MSKVKKSDTILTLKQFIQMDCFNTINILQNKLAIQPKILKVIKTTKMNGFEIFSDWRHDFLALKQYIQRAYGDKILVYKDIRKLNGFFKILLKKKKYANSKTKHKKVDWRGDMDQLFITLYDCNPSEINWNVLPNKLNGYYRQNQVYFDVLIKLVCEYWISDSVFGWAGSTPKPDIYLSKNCVGKVPQPYQNKQFLKGFYKILKFWAAASFDKEIFNKKWIPGTKYTPSNYRLIRIKPLLMNKNKYSRTLRNNFINIFNKVYKESQAKYAKDIDYKSDVPVIKPIFPTIKGWTPINTTYLNDHFDKKKLNRNVVTRYLACLHKQTVQWAINDFFNEPFLYYKPNNHFINAYKPTHIISLNSDKVNMSEDSDISETDSVKKELNTFVNKCKLNKQDLIRLQHNKINDKCSVKKRILLDYEFETSKIKQIRQTLIEETKKQIKGIPLQKVKLKIRNEFEVGGLVFDQYFLMLKAFYFENNIAEAREIAILHKKENKPEWQSLKKNIYNIRNNKSSEDLNNYLKSFTKGSKTIPITWFEEFFKVKKTQVLYNAIGTEVGFIDQHGLILNKEENIITDTTNKNWKKIISNYTKYDDITHILWDSQGNISKRRSAVSKIPKLPNMKVFSDTTSTFTYSTSSDSDIIVAPASNVNDVTKK